MEITSEGKLVIGFTEELQVSESYKKYLIAQFNETRNETNPNDEIRIIPVRTGQEEELILGWKLLKITDRAIEIQL